MKFSLKIAMLVGAAIPVAAQAQPESDAAVEAQAEVQAEQQADPTADAAVDSADIVVTARRRAENLQDVPLSVTAVTGEKLENSGITDALSLQNSVPSLSTTTQGTTRSELAFSIRGQRTQETQLLTDPPVGTYFAEVVQARSIGFANTFYDIQSVQVLKGVQGTLFGRNMTGGAVLVEPNKPIDELAGEIRAQAGNYKLRDLYGMINVPIADGVAFRLAGKMRERNGFVRDITSGRDYEDQNFDTFRASLKIEPSSTIESNFIFDWNRGRTHGLGLLQTAINPNAPAIAGYATLRSFGIPVSDPVAEQARNMTFRRYRIDIGDGECGCTLDAYQKLPFEYLKNWGVTNRTTFDLGNVKLKNIAGFRHVKFNSLQDLDGIPGFLITAERFRDVKQYSEEFQVQGSAFSDRLDYVAGLYYFLEKGTDGSTASQFPELTLGALGLPLTTPTFQFVNASIGDGKAETGAVFAAGTFKISDELKVSGGIRYTKDKRDAGMSSYNVASQACLFQVFKGTDPVTGLPIIEVPSSFATCRQTNSASWNAVTWDATLQYEPNPDLTAYVSTRRGFRAGGFSLRATSTPEFEPFDPEYVQEYELGLKNRFRLGGDALLTANLAIFYQDYTNVQIQVSGFADNGQFLTVIANTAAQRNYGGEFEMTFSKGNLNLSAFYSYIGIDITKGRAPGQFELVGTPKHSLGANATYTLPLANDNGELVFNLNGSYRSMQHLDKDDVQANEPGYALLNARIGFENIAGTGFGAAIFVNNITNKYYRVGVEGIYNEAGFIQSSYGEPRMYGVEASFKF